MAGSLDDFVNNARALDGDTARSPGERDLRLQGVHASEVAHGDEPAQAGAYEQKAALDDWLASNAALDREVTGTAGSRNADLAPRDLGDLRPEGGGESATEYLLRRDMVAAAPSLTSGQQVAQAAKGGNILFGDQWMSPEERARAGAIHGEQQIDLADALQRSSHDAMARDPRGEFIKGFNAGEYGTEQAWHGMRALFNEAIGDEEGMREATRDYEHSLRVSDVLGGPRVARLEDVKSIGDAFDFMAGGLGQGLASTLPSLATGVGTMGVGTIVTQVAKHKAQKAILDATAKRIAAVAPGVPTREALLASAMADQAGAKAMSTLARYKLGAKITAGGAMYAASNVLESGGLYNELAEHGVRDWRTALGYGSASAVLDTAGMLFAIGKVLPAADDVAKDGILKILSSGVVKDFAQTAGVEGTTEGLQEMVHMAAILYEDPTFDMTGPDARSRVANAFAIGALTGGVMGGTARVAGNVGVAATRPKAPAAGGPAAPAAGGPAAGGPATPATPAPAAPAGEQVPTTPPAPAVHDAVSEAADLQVAAATGGAGIEPVVASAQAAMDRVASSAKPAAPPADVAMVPRETSEPSVAPEAKRNAAVIRAGQHDSKKLLDHVEVSTPDPRFKQLAQRLKGVFDARAFYPTLATHDRADLDDAGKAKLATVDRGLYEDGADQGRGRVYLSPTGTDTETVLHEYLHAATMRVYHRPATGLDRAAVAQVNAVAKRLRSMPKPAGVRQALWDHVTGGSAGDELLATVLTSAEARDVLSKIEMNEQETVLQRIVGAILKLLGINSRSERTAASEVEAAVNHFLDVSETARSPELAPVGGDVAQFEAPSALDSLLAESDVARAKSPNSRIANSTPGPMGVILDAKRTGPKGQPMHGRWLAEGDNFWQQLTQIVSEYPNATARVVRLPAEAGARAMAMRDRGAIASRVIQASELLANRPSETREEAPADEVDQAQLAEIMDALGVETVAEPAEEETPGAETADESVVEPGLPDDTLRTDDAKALSRAATLASKAKGLPRLLARERELKVAENPQFFVTLRAPTYVEKGGRLEPTGGKSLAMYVPDLQLLGRELRGDIEGALAEGGGVDERHLDVLLALEALSEPDLWPKRPATTADVGVYPDLALYAQKDGAFVDEFGDPVMVVAPLRVTQKVTEKGSSSMRDVYYLPFERGNEQFWTELLDKVVSGASGKNTTFAEIANAGNRPVELRVPGDDMNFESYKTATAAANKVVSDLAAEITVGSTPEISHALTKSAEQATRAMRAYLDAHTEAQQLRSRMKRALEPAEAIAEATKAVYAKRLDDAKKAVDREGRLQAAFKQRFPGATQEDLAAMNRIASMPRTAMTHIQFALDDVEAEVARLLGGKKRPAKELRRLVRSSFRARYEALKDESLPLPNPEAVDFAPRAAIAGPVEYDIDRLKELYGDDIDPNDLLLSEDDPLAGMARDATPASTERTSPETRDPTGQRLVYSDRSEERRQAVIERLKKDVGEKRQVQYSDGIAALDFSDDIISTMEVMQRAVPVYGDMRVQTMKELVTDLVRRVGEVDSALKRAAQSPNHEALVPQFRAEKAWLQKTLASLQVEGKAGVVLLDPTTSTIHIALGDLALTDVQGGLIALSHEFGHVVERLALSPYANVLPNKGGLLDTDKLGADYARYKAVEQNPLSWADWLTDTYGVDGPTARLIAGFVDNVKGEPFHEWMATQWMRFVARTRLNATATERAPGYSMAFFHRLGNALSDIAKKVASLLGLKKSQLEDFSRDYFAEMIYRHTGMTSVVAGTLVSPAQFAQDARSMVTRPYAMREFGPMYMTSEEAWAEVRKDSKAFLDKQIVNRKFVQNHVAPRISPFMKTVFTSAREAVAKIIMWNTAYIRSMQNLTPKLKAIVDIFDGGQFNQFWMSNRTRFWAQYLTATNKLSQEHKDALYKLLLARTNFNDASVAMPDEVREAGKAVKQLTAEMYIDAAEIIAAAGGQTFLETEFAFDRDYGIQRVWNPEAIMANQNGFLRAMKANGVNDIDAFAFLAKIRQGETMEKSHDDLSVKPGTAGTMRGRTLPPTMVGIEEFLEPSMDAVMRQYISQMTKTAALARYFGGTYQFDSGETGFWPTAKINVALNEARNPLMSASITGKYAGDPNDQGAAEAAYSSVFRAPMFREDIEYLSQKAFPALLGRLGQDISPQMRKFITRTQAILNLLLLPFSTLASFPDMAGMLIRSRDLKMTTAAFREYMQGMDREQMRQTAELLGFVTSEALDEFTAGMYNDGLNDDNWAGKLNHKLFTWNQQMRYTKFTRTVATSVAKKWLREHYERARAGDEKAIELLQEVLPYKTSEGAFLESAKQFTVDELLDVMDVWARHDFNLVALHEHAVRQKLSGGADIDAGAIAADKVMQDVFAVFVNQSILNPHAADRPVWASDPKWALVFHLKQFAYSFHKVILTRLFDDFAKAYATADLRYAAHTAAMITPLLGLAAAGLLMRNFLQYTVLGWGEEPPEDRTMDGGMAYLNQILQRSGIFGLFQFPMDVERQAENGGFWPTVLLGPAASKVNDFVTAVSVDDDKWGEGLTNEMAKLFPPFSWSTPLRQNTLSAID